MAEYYAQRASAGLVITECTMVSPLSNGYLNCPGIYSPEQTVAWRQVTEAVHAQGGKIFLQLWHSGRIAHPSLLGGEMPVAPSAIAAADTMLYTPLGKVAVEIPRALDSHEIPHIVGQFERAAQNALTAGFDGVELHGAFGYLIDQFLQDGSNQRTDDYGGTIENRYRFLREVINAVCGVWGSDHVGIKLSPSNTFHGMIDANPKALFSYVIEQLNRAELAYIHLMEPNAQDLATRDVIKPVLTTFGPLCQRPVIANGGYDQATGNQVLAAGQAALVSFGTFFIANPDLPRRFAADAPLASPDVATYYGQGDQNLDQGYTDYPAIA